MIRGVLVSMCVVYAGVLVTEAAAQSKGKLKPAPRLRLPPYSEKVLELTAERLDDMERRLTAQPDPAADEKRRVAAQTARSKWTQCRDGVAAGMARSQPRPDPAQMEAAAKQREKILADFQQKMQTAKTPQQQQAAAMEMQAAMQAIGTPGSAPSADYRSQIEAKCGREPEPFRATQRGDFPDAPSGFRLMLERAGGFCRERPTYVGPDGALSTSASPFDISDKGMANIYNAEVYSPREAAELEKRCARLAPYLRELNFM